MDELCLKLRDFSLSRFMDTMIYVRRIIEYNKPLTNEKTKIIISKLLKGILNKTSYLTYDVVVRVLFLNYIFNDQQGELFKQVIISSYEKKSFSLLSPTFITYFFVHEAERIMRNKYWNLNENFVFYAPVIVKEQYYKGIGFDLSTTHKTKVGILIAGNSGRPGGSIYSSTDILDYKNIHLYHKTQEEQVVSNWLLTSTRFTRFDDEKIMKETFIREQKKKLEKTKNMIDILDILHMMYLFKTTIHEKWGFKDISTNTMTIQGIDYTTTTDPYSFASAWVVDFALLSDDYTTAPVLTEDIYPATLVFIGGPNAGATRGQTSTTGRTLNKLAAKDYTFFKECLKKALASGLDALIMRGVNIAVIPKVSTGIYAGKHMGNILRDFKPLLEEVLNEPAMFIKDDFILKRSLFFKELIISKFE